MRELTMDEIRLVGGAGDECAGDDGGGGNDLAGVKDSENFGKDLINIYEGLVEATSHIIERVARAL